MTEEDGEEKETQRCCSDKRLFLRDERQLQGGFELERSERIVSLHLRTGAEGCSGELTDGLLKAGRYRVLTTLPQGVRPSVYLG